MTQPLSGDLRRRVVTAVAGGMSRRGAAKRFGIAPSTAIKWVRAWRLTGSFRPRPQGGDRRSHRIEARAETVLALVEETPVMTLAEIAAHLESEHGVRVNKSDRNDARGIAQMVRANLIRPVHVKTISSQKQRMLLTNRRFMLRQLCDVEANIRGTLRNFGLKVGKVSRCRFEARIRELVEDEAALTCLVAPMLRARAALLTAFNELHRIMLDQVRADPVCRRLMTVPGVGPVTALTFRATVDVPARFARSRSVGAHFGLTPRKWQSGEIDRMGRISKCGDAMMRTVLYEAATVMLTRTTRWSWLKAWAMQVAKRRGQARARVALARRLGVILHRIWVDNSEFRWSREGAGAAA